MGFIFKIQLSQAIKNGIAKPRENNGTEKETPKLPMSFPRLLAFAVISRRPVHFPWDRINWIKEEPSSEGEDLIIPWDLLKPVLKMCRFHF